MKELSIEEKAKAYDIALDKIKRLLGTGSNCSREELEYVFPELKESEDDKVEKAIFGVVYDSDNELWGGYDVSKSDVLAWLEKQGEKDEEISVLKDQIESLHAAIKAIKETHRIELEKQGEQKPADKKGMNIVEEDMTPFQKKVFCIIDTTIEEEHGLKQVCDELLRLAHDEIMQKPAWSEEDKNVVEDIEEAVINNWFGDTQYIILDWLKSLKDRVQPQNRWRPSDVQMKQLGWVAEQNKDNMIGKELVSLYQDLKKLKG